MKPETLRAGIITTWNLESRHYYNMKPWEQALLQPQTSMIHFINFTSNY